MPSGSTGTEAAGAVVNRPSSGRQLEKTQIWDLYQSLRNEASRICFHLQLRCLCGRFWVLVQQMVYGPSWDTTAPRTKAALEPQQQLRIGFVSQQTIADAFLDLQFHHQRTERQEGAGCRPHHGPGPCLCPGPRPQAPNPGPRPRPVFYRQAKLSHFSIW